MRDFSVRYLLKLIKEIHIIVYSLNELFIVFNDRELKLIHQFSIKENICFTLKKEQKTSVKNVRNKYPFIKKKLIYSFRDILDNNLRTMTRGNNI